MGEQATLEFHLSFGDVLLHELVKTYKYKMLRHTFYIDYTSSHPNLRSIRDLG